MYKITIIDLETGTTDLDAVASSIVAGIQIPEEQAATAVSNIKGPVIHAAYAVRAARSAIDRMLKDPDVNRADRVLSLMDAAEKED